MFSFLDTSHTLLTANTQLFETIFEKGILHVIVLKIRLNCI